jgi:hypothetical protein
VRCACHQEATETERLGAHRRYELEIGALLHKELGREEVLPVQCVPNGSRVLHAIGRSPVGTTFWDGKCEGRGAPACVVRAAGWHGRGFGKGGHECWGDEVAVAARSSKARVLAGGNGGLTALHFALMSAPRAMSLSTRPSQP